jgi:HK97 family phage major capsid protein
MNVYESLIQKQAELSTLVATMAAENRGPSDSEKAQLETLKSDVAAIKASFESEGRKAFLSSLETKEDKRVLLAKGDSFETAVKGSYPDEYNRLSIAKYLRGVVTGEWEGAELERKAMTSSGNTVVIPTPLSSRIIDLARNRAAVFSAGASTVPMSSSTLKVARATGDVSADWYAENSTIDLSEAAFDSVDFTARKVATRVEITNELLEDGQGVDEAINNSISQAMALAIDYVSLHGSGTPPEPEGLYNNSDVFTVLTVGNISDYDKFLTAIYDIRGANYNPNAVIYNSAVAEKLAKLKTGLSGDKTPLVAPADFQALSKFVSNQTPVDIGSPTEGAAAFVGQFSFLWVGMRRNLLIEVSREAENSFKNDTTQIRCTARLDVQVAQPHAFSVMKGFTSL